MAWIESHTVLIRHRKLRPLAFDLRLKPVYVLGHLHALWHVALEQAEDGDLSHWTDEFIADSACFSGDPHKFVQLLQKHKWLDGRIIHDWMDYAGRYLDAKYRTSNPERLKGIIEKHEKVKSDFSQTLVRQPNPPNQPDQPKKAQPYWAAFKELNQELMKEVSKGFNIYQFLTKLKNDKKIEIPEDVISRICVSYQRNKAGIKADWAWFVVTTDQEWKNWNAGQNVKESNTRKEEARAPVSPAIAQIIAGMKKK